MNIKKQTALSFDDVVIEPEYSNVKRGEADVTPKPFKNIAPKIPIISSPMSSVTEFKMIQAMFKLGGIGIHHRYCEISKLNTLEMNIWFNGRTIPLAVGSIPSHKETIDILLNSGHKFFCVDVANGAHVNALNTIKYIREKCPEADIMSGNVATKDQAKRCIFAGANILRVGIGAGSVCITREVTGCGIPMLQSIMDIAEMLKNPFTPDEITMFKDIILVCDGGIRTSGDLVKALAAGADYVILGKLLAGSKESPSNVFPDPYTTDLNECIDEISAIDDTGKPRKNARHEYYKQFFGMASSKALIEQNGKDPNHLHVEGVETTVPYTGPVANTINQLVNGLKQGLFYTGSHNLEELKDSTFRVVTNNGRIEGSAHGAL